MKKLQIRKCEKIAEHYGKSSQETTAVSEIIELAQVLTRRLSQRGPNWREKLLDGLADATIVIQQLRLLYHVSDEDFEAKIEEKLDKQLEKIRDGNGA